MGHDVETVWHGILNVENGMGEMGIFDASTFPTKFSAEVKDFDLSTQISQPQKHSGCLRGSSFALGATAQACKQAGIDIETDSPTDGIDRNNMGIYLGAGEGAVDTDAFFNSVGAAWDSENREMDWKKWSKVALEKMTGTRELEQEANMPSGHLAVLTGARATNRSCLTACAASTQAIGEATLLIRSGKADVMIAGGAHSMIHPLGITGFNRLTALSTRNDSPETASRPFSGSRDGFVIGEGAAILVLESFSSAKKRGAKILAEVIGFGSSSDAFRVTDMHEEARGGRAAINYALEDAGIEKEKIDYINTHGTSTKENDSIETKAIKMVFGDNAKNIPVSSTKSMSGHLIGAAGAAELIFCALALRDQTIPPTANLNDSDPDLDLDYVPNKPRKADLNIVMSESFGFGGQNDAVIIKKFEE